MQGGWGKLFRTIFPHDERELGMDGVRAVLQHDVNQSVFRGITFSDGAPVPTGHVDLPSLKELRDGQPAVELESSQAVLHHMSAMSNQGQPGIQYELDCIESDERVMIQMASQFNLLEMMSPQARPEHGVAIYAHDHTQGPSVCSRTVAAAMYRNYLMPVKGGVGQSHENGRFIDTTEDLISWLSKLSTDAGHGTIHGVYRNGYLDFSDEDMEGVIWAMNHISNSTELKEQATGLLRVGVHRNAPLNGPKGTDPVHSGAKVDLVLSAALPLGSYSIQWPRGSEEARAALGTLASIVLEATYEATLRLLAQKQQPTRLILTTVGGGAFQNKETWILAAIANALQRTSPLLGQHEVWLNHHKTSNSEARIEALKQHGVRVGTRRNV